MDITAYEDGYIQKWAKRPPIGETPLLAPSKPVALQVDPAQFFSKGEMAGGYFGGVGGLVAGSAVGHGISPNNKALGAFVGALGGTALGSVLGVALVRAARVATGAPKPKLKKGGIIR